MTEYEKNELLDALAVLQKTCILHPNCDTCPLSDRDGDCFFTSSATAPKDWDIEKPKHPIWKVFK